MARGVNKVILVGNLGTDPETRKFQDGGSVTNINVATSEAWRDKQTGQMQDRTEWHRVVLRDRGNYRLGQIAAQYLRKGSKVYIEGALRTSSWEADGQTRYKTEIIANEMQMLDSRGGGAGGGGGRPPMQEDTGQYGGGGSGSARGDQYGGSRPEPVTNPDTLGGDIDDDIPF